MLALAWLSAWCFAWAARGAELDLARHELVQVTQRGTVEHSLRFEGVDQEISLSCSVPMRSFGEGEPEQAGFDPSTLELAWLDPGRLVSVRWGTFAVGQGRYSQQGQLVLLFDGGRFHELFRDIIYAYGRAGIADSSARRLDVYFDRAAGTLRLAGTDANRWSREKSGPSDEPALLEREVHPDDGAIVYVGAATTRRVWKYRLAPDRLEFLRVDRYVNLGNEEHPVELVAKAFDVSVADLRRLNPALGAQHDVRGVVRVDGQLGPYVPEREDRISGPACP